MGTGRLRWGVAADTMQRGSEMEMGGLINIPCLATQPQ